MDTYHVKGYYQGATVFEAGDVVPNTFGNFAKVVNSQSNTIVDTVEISLESFTGAAVGNPTGVDNIAVEVTQR